MDKSRKQFEEWRSKNKSSTINLFNVWQASRESLEVELPVKLPTMDDDSFEEGLCEGYNNAIDDFKQILISNGVKIKK
ncbi:TPA: hypothetical protein SMM89_003410 [Proteus mirabilis]|uniref:hypothetical protein n=1 Tax=Proteus TaxID=583 RepID=UPI0013781DA4|nr:MULTISPECIES: hypothetical protein [Proteus]MBN4015329.1 hypothetical protein [Proteus mirabilis]NBM73890.1 hypothetical protein [Proteus sp. G4406]NBN27721.1 hypothetical protein [Proteus sp. G4408]HEJ9470216.1 hypothetical protein [Proteus mirabilis]HEK1156781.1 hypothetical protein [Proteus mirabilis]